MTTEEAFGRLEEQLKRIAEDVRENLKEAKATNGRVTRLEQDKAIRDSQNHEVRIKSVEHTQTVWKAKLAAIIAGGTLVAGLIFEGVKLFWK
jgi:hypothetical protein